MPEKLGAEMLLPLTTACQQQERYHALPLQLFLTGGVHPFLPFVRFEMRFRYLQSSCIFAISSLYTLSCLPSYLQYNVHICLIDDSVLQHLMLLVRQKSLLIILFENPYKLMYASECTKQGLPLSTSDSFLNFQSTLALQLLPKLLSRFLTCR